MIFLQLIMSILQLGTLSVLLSDVLISGFTTGAAVHVLTSQLTGLFGLQLPEDEEFPKIFRVYPLFQIYKYAAKKTQHFKRN